MFDLKYNVFISISSETFYEQDFDFNSGTCFTYGQSGSGKTFSIDAMRTFTLATIHEEIENVKT